MKLLTTAHLTVDPPDAVIGITPAISRRSVVLRIANAATWFVVGRGRQFNAARVPYPLSSRRNHWRAMNLAVAPSVPWARPFRLARTIGRLADSQNVAIELELAANSRFADLYRKNGFLSVPQPSSNGQRLYRPPDPTRGAR